MLRLCRGWVTRFEATEGNQKRRTEDGKDYVKTEDGAIVYDKCELRTIVTSPVYANNDPKHENSHCGSLVLPVSHNIQTCNPDL